MRGFSNRAKIILGIVAALLIGGLFFPAPMPEVSLPAERITNLLGLPISNTMIAAWITMILLLLLSWRATRRMDEVPRGLQNLVELAIEGLLSLVQNVAGKEHGRRFFPLVATIFLFIVVSNWLGLFPGYGTIGLVHPKEEHALNFQTTHIGELEVGYIPLGRPAQTEAAGGEGAIQGVLVPFLRSANTDLNTTLALALVAMFFVEYWGFSTLGFRGYAGKFFNLKGGFIGLFVGFMELVSEFARIISFTFRLFGNIFAGEVLLGVIGFLIPWVVILPFYGLELFVGFIQALIFAMLTLAFGTMAVASHGEGGHEEHRAQH